MDYSYRLNIQLTNNRQLIGFTIKIQFSYIFKPCSYRASTLTLALTLLDPFRTFYASVDADTNACYEWCN